MSEPITSDAKERVLNVAEQLFSERGYKSVTLRDIATALQIKHASLYHHVSSKEALFIEVMERSFRRHQAGLETAIHSAGADIEGQLQAAARWLLAQPLLDLGRMMNSDMTAIDEAHAHRLSFTAYESVLMPIAHVFRRAAEAGSIRPIDPPMLGGAILAFVESVHTQRLPLSVYDGDRGVVVDALIDVMLNGLRLPPPATPASVTSTREN
jgi:AcrR family transcriptional regulator